jgi:hypothetical protein
MYLPDEIPGAQVLITVKTYPLPSNQYGELVCTAGFLPDGKWIRLYPILFRALPYERQYSKYQWVTLDLVRNIKDFRPESYRLNPKYDIDKILVGAKIETGKGKNRDWSERKKYTLNEVFTSMNDLIIRAKSDERKSLAVLKPREIIKFEIEADEREWKPEWQDQLRQFNLFDLDEQGQGKKREVVKKLPYKYSYKFLSEGDKMPRKMMIEDWEIGALYWKCLKRCGGDENKANQLVREKYFDEFIQKDIYFFLGTTLQYHLVAPNPFVIVGLFTPPKPKLAIPEQTTFQADGIEQQKLFD